MKRAFFISIDAVIAVLLAFALLTTSLLLAGRIRSRSVEDASVKMASEDALAVLEKTGVLQLTPQSGGVTEARQVLLNAPEGVCLRLRVFKASGNALLRAVTMPGCNNTADFTQVTRRSFVYNREFYFAEMAAWRRAG